jgi:mono/diheme cytochrome c family protein
MPALSALRLPLGLAALLALGACAAEQKPGEVGHHPNQTGVEYSPQMYHSIPANPYSQLERNRTFADGKNAQAPVRGTVARGKEGYLYPYKQEDYELAGAELRSPLPATAANLAAGQRIFNLNCVQCHGVAGDGGGTIPATGKYPTVPKYWAPERMVRTEGHFYHTIVWGKAAMGSHASQLNPTERWQVLQWVLKLREEGYRASLAGAAPADTAKKAGAKAPTTPAKKVAQVIK